MFGVSHGFPMKRMLSVSSGASWTAGKQQGVRTKDLNGDDDDDRSSWDGELYGD